MKMKDPEVLLLLIPLALAVFYYFRRERSLFSSLHFSSIKILSTNSKGLRAKLRNLPMVLKVIGVAFAIFALSRPQSSTTQMKRNVEGIDIMICLDISDSMLIEDMPPYENRLEAAKDTIKKFVEKRSSDRIGLVIFSGESYTRIPPTLDYKMLLQSLKDVKITRTMKMGTAIGVALANGVARLRDSTAKSRVLVLLTDGENNTGTISPETSIDIAKGYSIRIYSIGAGRDGQAQLPVYAQDAFGNTHKTYQPIHSSVNDDLLGRMASETGGKYFRASDGNALEKVFSDIDRLEKTKVEVNQYTRYTELFQNYLKWGLMFYVSGFLSSIWFLRRSP